MADDEPHIDHFTTDDHFHADMDVPESELSLADRLDVAEPRLEILGYDASGPDEAHVCCSECGERLEMVDGKGAVCGCPETPQRWLLEAL